MEAALKAYVAKPDYSGLLALAGSGAMADDYDPKEPYGRRKPEPELKAIAKRRRTQTA